jgi:hypothetical protein
LTYCLCQIRQLHGTNSRQVYARIHILRPPR